MTAARYDITIDQGSDFNLELIVKDTGTARDFSRDETVSGQEKRWGARASYRKTLESSTAYNMVAVVPQDHTGKIVLQHNRDHNISAPAGTYYYDLELYQYDDSTAAQNAFSNSGTAPAEFSVTRLIGGTLTLRREVTR